jgi:hypothetical protein
MFIGISTAIELINTTGTKQYISAIIISGLGSIGVYRLTTLLITWLLSRWEFLLKIVLGPYYLKGTWVGVMRTKQGRKLYIVEKYEQSLSNLTARGWSYTLEGQLESNWTTEAIQIDPHKGEAFFFHSVNVPYKENVLESLGKLQFDRKNERSGPHRMNGYFVDTDTTVKLQYETLNKISDFLLDLDSAKKTALENFKS